MKDKLPKIDKQKITNLKTKVQEEYYYHRKDKITKEDIENKNTNIKLDEKQLIKKIESILNSKNFIYQADVNIIYKNDKNINKKIIGFIDNNIITKDGEKININEIKNIK